MIKFSYKTLLVYHIPEVFVNKLTCKKFVYFQYDVVAVYLKAFVFLMTKKQLLKLEIKVSLIQS